jgi:hypothetical protein
MPVAIKYLFLFLLMNFVVLSQNKPVKVIPKKTVKSLAKYPRRTNLALGFGVTRSVVYLSRNVKPDNDATGLNTSLIYGGSKLFRVSFEYTHYKTLNIAPTWYDIRANTIEVNMHALARFRNRNAYFYPLFGLSYNRFSGIYTGVSDFLNLKTLYEPNKRAYTRWIGLNIGTGYEIYFKPGSFFLDYKMRIGFTEGYNKLNIQDVCITAGLRFNLRVKSIYSIFLYRGTRSRYLLDTSDDN